MRRSPRRPPGVPAVLPPRGSQPARGRRRETEGNLPVNVMPLNISYGHQVAPQSPHVHERARIGCQMKTAKYQRDQVSAPPSQLPDPNVRSSPRQPPPTNITETKKLLFELLDAEAECRPAVSHRSKVGTGMWSRNLQTQQTESWKPRRQNLSTQSRNRATTRSRTRATTRATTRSRTRSRNRATTRATTRPVMTNRLLTVVLLLSATMLLMIPAGAGEGEGDTEGRPKRHVPNWAMTSSDFFGWVEELRKHAGYDQIEDLARTFWAHFPSADRLGYGVHEPDE
ncbi:uncharacterized protein LOC121635915 [Melanotaenia boesemani]|uniref:uncharacterized protein LOC121635915 n=1 Tax=Melanotaenia boesemani TaxID=1250792 RepID=UPI001C03BB3F|nr:uncharacterized protein LOC121635915 [Melanotaenia boesemani]